MGKKQDEEDDTWSVIKNAVASTFDPAVQAKEEIAARQKERGYAPSQYDEDMKNSFGAKKKFQKGFSGN